MSKNIGKVWETYYRFYNTKKVYGKLRFTYEIIEKDKSKHLVKSELNTHLPSLIIAKNGDSQKEWIKTIRKSSMNEGRGSRGMHNLKWVSWKTDDTRNDNKYVIEYVKIVLDDKDTGMDLDEWNYKRIKCIEKDRTLEQVNDVLKFSKGFENAKSYTDGTTYKCESGYTLKEIYMNEDVIVHNQNDFDGDYSYEKLKSEGYKMKSYNCYEKEVA